MPFHLALETAALLLPTSSSASAEALEGARSGTCKAMPLGDYLFSPKGTVLIISYHIAGPLENLPPCKPFRFFWKLISEPREVAVVLRH